MIQTREIVNDVTIQVATVNGSGSMSANNLLTKAIFRMGIPVAPKNIFPSNIQGLPTWYTVRVSAEGYQARRKELDVLVAVNRATWFEDVPQVRPGGVVIHEASYPVEGKAKREDVLYYPVPFQKLADKYFGEPKVRKLLMNMI